MDINRTYFFTATILNWTPIFHHKNLVNIVLNSLKYLVDNKALALHSYVIMPNHIHLIITPLSENVQLRFMKFTAQKIKFYLQDHHPEKLNLFLVNKRDRKYQFWQRSPLSVHLKSRKMTEQKLDYIHNNPVKGKWSLSESPIDYEFSSIKFYELDEKNDMLTHYMDFI